MMKGEIVWGAGAVPADCNRTMVHDEASSIEGSGLGDPDEE